MEILYKNRSITSCLKTAYNFYMSNLKGILHALWLPVLLCGIFSAAFITLMISQDNSSIPFLQRPHLYVILVVVLCLASVITGIWAFARLSSFLNEMPRRWNFKRMSVVVMASLLVSLPILIFLVGGIWLMFIYGNAGSNVLIKTIFLVGVSLLALFLVVPMIYVNMKYLHVKEVNYLKAFSTNYRKAFRYVGFLFVTIILTLLLAFVITSVILLPLYVLLIAKSKSNAGVAMGDPADIPGYFIWLVYAAMVFACIVLWLIIIYEMLVCSFLYGSIEQKQAEMQEAKEMVSATNE